MNTFIANLSSEQLRRAATIKRQIATLESRLERILGGAAPTRAAGPKPKRKFRMSAAGRARIVAAQKARWAKIKGKGAKGARKGRRKMSAAARAKMAAIAKARWAKAKAAGRTTL